MPSPDTTNSIHLTTSKEWRRWLRLNHNREREVWLISYKKHTGKSGIEYEHALEEAICFGWIDALVRRIDDDRFARRWMPRRPGGTWSGTNRAIAKRLVDEGRMTKAGLAVLGPIRRKTEQAPVTDLAPDVEAAFKKNKKAWAFFQSLTPGYRKRYLTWIGAAKREETRRGRIAFAKRQLARGVKSLIR